MNNNKLKKEIENAQNDFQEVILHYRDGQAYAKKITEPRKSKTIESNGKYSNKVKVTANEASQEIAKTSFDTLMSSNVFLTAIAKSSLKRIVGSFDYIKNLESQLAVIENMLNLYKSDKNVYEENLAKYKILKAAYISSKKSFELKTSSDYKEERKKIQENPDYNELMKESESLKDKKSQINITSIRKFITKRKKFMDLYSDPVESYDGETVTYTQHPTYELAKQQLFELYSNLIETLPNVFNNLTVDDLNNMTTNQIVELLHNEKDSINVDLKLNKMDLARKVNEIAGDNVANIIFEEFDLTNNNDLRLAKELFVSSNVSAVASIANVVAKSYGISNKEDIKDLIGQGLLIITEQFDIWKNDQITLNVPLTTTMYVTVRLWRELKRYAFEYIKNGNMMSYGSYLSTKEKFSEEFKKWETEMVKEQPSFKDYDLNFKWQLFLEFLNTDEGLEFIGFRDTKTIRAALSRLNFSLNNQASMNTDSNAQQENTDKFTKNIDLLNSTNSGETLDYGDMFAILKKMFNLKKTITKNGANYEKPLFDKVDLLILMCLFGVEGDRNMFNKNGKILYKGIIKYLKNKGFDIKSEAAISLRISNLTEKINNLALTYPIFDRMPQYIEALMSGGGDASNNSYKKLKNDLTSLYNSLKK